MPPYSLTRDTIQATIMEITVISYIPVTPVSHCGKHVWQGSRLPVATPHDQGQYGAAQISTTNTLMPISAPTSTTR